MEQFLNFLYNNILNKFYKKSGLISGLIFIFLFFLLKEPKYLGFTLSLFQIMILFIVIEALWVSIWIYFQNKFPKTKNGKKGICIAINTENDDLKIKIKRDFIEEFEKIITHNNLSNIFEVHFLNEFQSQKIKSILDILYKIFKKSKEERDVDDNRNVKRFNKINKKLKSIYFVWGDIRLRTESVEQYFVNLEGIILHNYIEKDVSTRLSKEFTNNFLREFSIFSDHEKSGFDTLVKSNFITATYIIGIAALVSGEFELSLKLHKLVKEQISILSKIYPQIKVSEESLNDLIFEENMHLAHIYFNIGNYRKAQFFNDQYIIAEQFKERAISQRIIIEYYLGDLNSANVYNEKLKELNKNNLVWWYNKAFLLMCQGKFEEGYRNYIQLLQNTMKDEDELVKQCIDFDTEVLKHHPENGFIYFILGFLYYEKLNNPSAAYEHYETFLNLENLSIFPTNMIEKAKNSVEKIKIEIKIE